ARGGEIVEQQLPILGSCDHRPAILGERRCAGAAEAVEFLKISHDVSGWHRMDVDAEAAAERQARAVGRKGHEKPRARGCSGAAQLRHDPSTLQVPYSSELLGSVERQTG